jgi:hypothetical protein
MEGEVESQRKLENSQRGRGLTVNLGSDGRGESGLVVLGSDDGGCS